MKPTAIALAEELEDYKYNLTASEAAEELRRLHKQNIALIELLSAQNDLIKSFINPISKHDT
jgi:hypothetical protein